MQADAPRSDPFIESILAAGGQVGPDGVCHFADPVTEVRAAAEGTVAVALTHLGFVRVAGDEARDFLQAQLATDVRPVTAERSTLAAWCSPRGRVLASFRLLLRDDAFWMVLPREQVEPVSRRLRMFVLRSRVVVDPVEDGLAALGLAGEAAAETLAALGLPAPAEPGAVSGEGGAAVVRAPGPAPRFEIYAPPADLARIWSGAVERVRPAGTTAWQYLEVEAGVPVVPLALSDAFVPQMLNLQALGAVSFRKGCYPGQEVVARTQYLGKLKRRLYPARSGAPASVGDEIFPAGEPQPAGRVVSAAPGPDGTWHLLAVIQIAEAEAGDLHLGAPDGPPLALAPLPYPLEAAGGG